MRIRINYAKEGNLVYTSTLDIQKLWERSMRRAGLVLQYSQGFHPQPRIQIANPLPLGFTGLHELVDIWLKEENTPVELIIARLQKALPIGIRINEITEIPTNDPSLPKQVEYSEYTVFLRDYHGLSDDLKQKCTDMLGRDSIPRVRNRKNYDLRPLITKLAVNLSKDGFPVVSMRLPTNPNKTGRPEEVMDELGFRLDEFKVIREKLVLKELAS